MGVFGPRIEPECGGQFLREKYITSQLLPGMAAHPLHLALASALRRQMQLDLCKVEASLVYIVSTLYL